MIGGEDKKRRVSVIEFVCEGIGKTDGHSEIALSPKTLSRS